MFRPVEATPTPVELTELFDLNLNWNPLLNQLKTQGLQAVLSP